MLEVLHTVEGVLKRAREVLLNILSTRTLIGGHHHDGVSIDVGIEVDGQLLQRKETQDNHCHKDEDGGDRPFY